MSQETLLVIAGIIVPFVIQFVKTVYKSVAGSDMTSDKALTLTYVMCFLMAIAAKALSGELSIPAGTSMPTVVEMIVTQFALVVGLATVVYKALLASSTGLFSKKQ